MNPWLAALLIVAAVVLAWLVVRQVNRQLARRQAESEEYWRGQLADLARPDIPDYQPFHGSLL